MNYKTIANCAVTNETLSPENTIMTPCNQPLSASFLRSYTRKLRWDQQPIQCPLCRNDKQFTKRLTEKGINTAPFDKSNYTTYENIKKLIIDEECNYFALQIILNDNPFSELETKKILKYIGGCLILKDRIQEPEFVDGTTNTELTYIDFLKQLKHDDIINILNNFSIKHRNKSIIAPNHTN